MAVFIEHINGENIGELTELNKNEILVGRLPNCDIVTEPIFSSVSQRHCILRKTSRGWMITDIGTYNKGSSYGTYVNDGRLTPNMPTLLSPGDEVRLGTKLGKYFRFIGEGTMPVREPVQLKERLIVDLGKRCIFLDGRRLSLHLTNQEFKLVSILWAKSGEVCTFKEICNEIWPNENSLNRDTVDADLRVRVNTLAHTLRRKMSASLDGMDILESYPGVGYRLLL
jgi:pSer/pThr/pTyr-binding forkhead associated (FHA) protein